MWVVKLSMCDEEDIIVSRAKRFGVTVFGYPLSRFRKNSKIYLSGCGLLVGKEKNKKAFVKDLVKERSIKKFEVRGDFYIALMSRPELKKVEETLVDPSFVYLKPVVISPSGEEIWEFASWDRALLMKKVRLAKRKYNANVLKIEHKKLGTLSIFNVVPELTPKQKQALEIAIKGGYYEYPRKSELRELAKKMGISFSTYQAHLRKAEGRLLPYLMKSTSF